MMLFQNRRALPRPFRRTVRLSVLALISLAALGAGGCGASKPAEAPGCPSGTVLHGKDCLPEGEGEAAKPEESGNDSPEATTKGAAPAKAEPEPVAEETPVAPPPKKKKPAAAPPSETPPDTTSSGAAGGQPSYDKEAVTPILKRAVRQIKANCGAATDEDGESGPWGKTKVTVTLGRNGHTKAVAVASDFEGKPAGNCIVQAFKKLVFSPYSASTDESVELDLVVTKPATPVVTKPAGK